MKKILLMNVVLTAFTAMAGTANIDVPRSVLYEFRRQFGSEATVRWEKTKDKETNKNMFVGHFIQKGIWSEAYFDEAGDFLGVGRNITLDQLPPKVLNKQQDKYKGYNVMEVYEYYLKDAIMPVYGLTITNDQRMIFLKIDELGFFSEVKKEKYKN